MLVDTEEYEINMPKIKKLIEELNSGNYLKGYEWKFESGIIKKYWHGSESVMIPLVPIMKTDKSSHITVRTYKGVPYEVDDVNSVWLASDNSETYDLNDMMSEYIDKKRKIKVTVMVEELKNG